MPYLWQILYLLSPCSQTTVRLGEEVGYRSQYCFYYMFSDLNLFTSQAKEWSGGNRGEELEKSSKDRDIQPTGKDKRPWV